MAFYEPIDTAAAESGGITLTNINDATDIIPLQITQSVLGESEKLYRVDPADPNVAQPAVSVAA